MPFGMSMPKYVSLVSLAMGSMLAGGSVVHAFYQPDLTIPDAPIPKPKSMPRIEIVEPRGQR